VGGAVSAENRESLQLLPLVLRVLLLHSSIHLLLLLLLLVFR
jgi:hypothetical protein